ncbi:MAG TPA: DUF2461 domain-containing protein [Chryseosolibacter sp.]|nr:DUF2461 domain-containing protein [Chryseosolibacter sp.]
MKLDFILKFLSDLAKHNDRDWFEKNKSRYLEAKEGFEEVVAAVLKELVKFEDGLAGLNPKKLPFRIYRDVRFSKDKRPYKTNMGAGFSPNGKLVQEPGYYLHIQPGNKSFIAGGMYMPDAGNLAKIRQEIDYNPDGLRKVTHTKKFRTFFGDFDEFDKLKTAPKGYPKDHPQIEWLKLKSFIVEMPLTDKQVRDKKFVSLVASGCKAIKPLNDYLREAIA